MAQASTLLIWILASVVALGPLSTDMYLPSLPAIGEVFSAPVSQVQMTLSIFLAGFAVAQLFYGPVADRYGRKPTLIAGLTLFTVATIGCAQAESIDQLILFRFLQALGACSGPILGRTIVRDVYGAQDSARALSMMGSIMALAPAAAPILGGFLLIWFDWQANFLFLMLYGVLAIALIVFTVPESLAEENRKSAKPSAILRNFGSLLSHRNYMGYALSCSFIFAGLFSFLSGSSFVLIDFFGVPEEHFGFYFAFVVFGYMAGTQVAQRLGSKYGINNMMKVSVILGVTAGMGMALPAIQGIYNQYWLIGCQFLFMMSVGILMPQAMAGALASFGHIAGTASSLLGFIQSSIAACAGLLVGHLHSDSPLTMSVTIACAGCCAALSFLLLVRDESLEAETSKV